MVSLSVILPIYNEENIVEESINQITSKLDSLVDKFEILAINDGSSDKTSTKLNTLAKKDKRLKILKHRKNKGYGAILKTGVEHAQYPWIFLTDSYIQFDAKELKNFLNHTEDYDFIVGYRKKRVGSLGKRFLSIIYNCIISLLFGLKLHDANCAFKLMRKASLKKINFLSNSFFVSVEFMVKANKLRFRIKELGINHLPKKNKQSKVTYKQFMFTIGDLIKSYFALM